MAGLVQIIVIFKEICQNVDLEEKNHILLTRLLFPCQNYQQNVLNQPEKFRQRYKREPLKIKSKKFQPIH